MTMCRVLGPVEVEANGHTLDLGGPTPRRLIAALALAGGRPVSDSRLAEQVWTDDGPASVLGALRVVVSRLRAALGPDDRAGLARTPLGYALHLPTDQERFTGIVADAAGRLDHDPAAAERMLASALDLWRGEPFADLGDEPVAVGARTRLTELRAAAVEDLLAARLARGDAAGAVAALSQAVTDSPYRERRWELLATALYRTGRQAHALTELRRVRELMIDELGVEPGPALRDLEGRMLRQDPSLLVPVRSEPAPPVILTPVTSFVGRERELQLIARLWAPGGPLTLVGPGGVGKTRLAIEAAAMLGGAGRLVRLADVHDPDGVASSVAAAIGLTQIAGDAVPLVRRALAGATGVLVLDNCEHLAAPVAHLVLDLLPRCPALHILITSRMPLGFDGERTVPVDPLPLTSPDGGPGPAIELLLERVRSGRATWTPSDGDTDLARDICSTLDGLPLAIEIAAARERALGLAGIAAHLRDRTDLLGATPRGSVNPHASLDAAIGWSVDTLESADRALVLRLWPFEGGFSWEAASAVQQAPGGRGVLASLAGLVDRSVVVADHAAGPGRFRLLETVRRYCRDADPDPAATAEAHAAWVRAFVVRGTAVTEGNRAGYTFHELLADLANVRAGLAHDLAERPLEALRSAAALDWVWPAVGLPREGVSTLESALARCPDAPSDDRVQALLALSSISFHGGGPLRAITLADDAIALLGDGHEALLAKALGYRAQAYVALGDADAVRDAAARMAACAEHPDVPDWTRASARIVGGLALVMGGEREAGEAGLRAARALSADCGFVWGRGTADLVLGWLAVADSERTAQAARRLVDALDAFEEQANLSDLLAVVYAIAHLGGSLPAATLRAAALEQAARIGADPRRYAWLGEPATGRAGGRPADADRTVAEEAGRTLDWDDMIALARLVVGRR